MSINITISDFERRNKNDKVIGFSIEDIAENISKSSNLFDKIVVIDGCYNYDLATLSKVIKIVTKEELFEDIKSIFNDYEERQTYKQGTVYGFYFYSDWDKSSCIIEIYNLNQKDYERFCNENKEMLKIF